CSRLTNYYEDDYGYFQYFEFW
nr:immunoglobulin heavy chain junction region [Macaca mulatta]